MKKLLLILGCLLALKGFSQTSEPFIQEKSSAWIRVTEDPLVAKKPSAVNRKLVSVRKKAASSRRQTLPKHDAEEEFEKTNQQVNRFKKQKKN